VTDIATFDRQIDSHLATLADDGDKAVYLNTVTDRLERGLSRLARWAADPDSAPQPPHNLTAFDIEERIGSVQLRLNDLRTRVRDRIAALSPLD